MKHKPELAECGHYEFFGFIPDPLASWHRRFRQAGVRFVAEGGPNSYYYFYVHPADWNKAIAVGRFGVEEAVRLYGRRPNPLTRSEAAETLSVARGWAHGSQRARKAGHSYEAAYLDGLAQGAARVVDWHGPVRRRWAGFGEAERLGRLARRGMNPRPSPETPYFRMHTDPPGMARLRDTGELVKLPKAWTRVTLYHAASEPWDLYTSIDPITGDRVWTGLTYGPEERYWREKNPLAGQAVLYGRRTNPYTLHSPHYRIDRILSKADPRYGNPLRRAEANQILARAQDRIHAARIMRGSLDPDAVGQAMMIAGPAEGMAWVAQDFGPRGSRERARETKYDAAKVSEEAYGRDVQYHRTLRERAGNPPMLILGNPGGGVYAEGAELLREALAAGSPTTGEVAAKLWTWSNRTDVPVAYAELIMRNAGYQPFKGYPLKRIRRGNPALSRLERGAGYRARGRGRWDKYPVWDVRAIRAASTGKLLRALRWAYGEHGAGAVEAIPVHEELARRGVDWEGALAINPESRRGNPHKGTVDAGGRSQDEMILFQFYSDREFITEQWATIRNVLKKWPHASVYVPTGSSTGTVVISPRQLKARGINPETTRARYRHERRASPGAFDPRSFRTIRRGKYRVVVGCPKGQWSPVRKVCKVGTRAQAVLRPKNPRRGAGSEQNPAHARPPGFPAGVWTNPAFQAELAAFRRRHGDIPIRVQRIDAPDGYPRFMSVYGRVPELKYDAPSGSVKGKRIHRFGKQGGKGAQPWAVTSVERGPKFLALLGGTFKAKTDWIFD
jgi:hypothetical protein